MKTLTLSITQHGLKVVAVAVMSADADGGDAVPLFGMDAIRATMLYLEEITDDSLAGAVEVTRMMQEGQTFEEIKARIVTRIGAERIANTIVDELQAGQGRKPQ